MADRVAAGPWLVAGEALVIAVLLTPKAAVSVIAGDTSRLKSVRVAGSPDCLAAALEKIC